MILDSRTMPDLRGIVVNEETGQRIPFVRWCDTDTGDWEAWAATPDGRQKLRPPHLVRGRCRLRFVPLAPRAAPKRTPPPRPGQARPGQRLVVLPGVRCERPGCQRLAEWQTADEQELEPEILPDGSRAERAKMVRTHRWCSWCYQWPLFTSLRGVVREVTSIKARPQ